MNFRTFLPGFAAQMFCEMLSRAELMVEENGCSLTSLFGENDGAKIHPYIYRSPARAAPRRAAGGACGIRGGEALSVE